MQDTRLSCDTLKRIAYGLLIVRRDLYEVTIIDGDNYQTIRDESREVRPPVIMTVDEALRELNV